MKKEEPLFLKIKEDIKNKIEASDFEKDKPIPTELELTKIYNVSRTTIRKATDQLAFEGYLKRISGVGTFVTQKAKISKTIRHYGFNQEMKQQNYKVKTVVKEFTAIEANKEISELVNVNEHDMVYFFKRIRYGNNEPLQYEKTYMSIKKYPDINVVTLQNSKYDYIEKIKGQKIDFCVHEIIPILATQELADIFQIDINSPILQISNTTYLSDGSIMDFTLQYNNPKKYQMKYIRKKENE